MRKVTISAGGRIVLPAELRRRYGMQAGTVLELRETGEGLNLRVARGLQCAGVQAFAGLFKARPSGEPRRILDFDAASILAPKRRT